MSVGLELEELLAYSDHERDEVARLDRGRSGAAADSDFQPGGRFPTVWGLLDHVFLDRAPAPGAPARAERRSETRPASRLVTGTALFEYADLVRADLRQFITGLT